LLGEKKGSFPLKGSNWFARPVAMTPEAWRSDLTLLEDMHRKMRAAIAGLAPRDLDRISSGIAAHDVYHAGQIQLLKRLHRQRNQTPSRS
jgi:hypothetical protein